MEDGRGCNPKTMSWSKNSRKLLFWNLKYHFFSCQDGSSDYFTFYGGGRVGGGKGWTDAVLLTLIDNCIVFVVNVHTLFIVNGGFDINELKQTLRISEKHLSVLFYVKLFLVWMSWENDTGSIVIWPAWSLIFVEALQKLANPLVTLGLSL